MHLGISLTVLRKQIDIPSLGSRKLDWKASLFFEICIVSILLQNQTRSSAVAAANPLRNDWYQEMRKKRIRVLKLIWLKLS